MRTMTIAVLLILVVVLMPPTFAQERQRDTMATGHIQLADPGMGPGGATFIIPPQLEPIHAFSSPTFFFEGVPAVGGMGRSPLGFEVKQDLLAPLRAQWAREAQTSTFRTILGSIQLAGVAYLAARQLTGAGIMTARPRPVRPRK